MSGYFQEMCDRLEHLVRSLHPHHRARPSPRQPGDLEGDGGERATSISTATRAGIRSATRPFTTRASWSTGEGGEKLSPQGTPVEWTVEESWFFRLSKYQQPLLDHYARQSRLHPPESRRNEVLRFVEGGLKDLSVSRTSFDWGVPVPGSAGPRHVRLARRADQLHDRRRLSRRDGDCGSATGRPTST